MAKKETKKKTVKKSSVSKPKTKRDTLVLKKKAFLELYPLRYGNISVCAKELGINRTSIYKWIKDDPKFLQDLEDTKPKEIMKDILEDALMKRINAGDTTAIIFALKTQAKDRGYNEKTDIDVNHKIEQIIIKPYTELESGLDISEPENK